MRASVAEIGRVLAAGGRLCAVVAHPVTDLEARAEAGFVTRADYFETQRVDDIVESAGLKVRLRGWTHTFEDYAIAFEAAGLVVETMREPRPADDAPSKFAQWREVPLFLFLRLLKMR